MIIKQIKHPDLLPNGGFWIARQRLPSGKVVEGFGDSMVEAMTKVVVCVMSRNEV